MNIRSPSDIYALDPEWTKLSTEQQTLIISNISEILLNDIVAENYRTGATTDRPTLKSLIRFKNRSLTPGIGDMSARIYKAMLKSRTKIRTDLNYLTIKTLAIEAFLNLYHDETIRSTPDSFSYFIFQNSPDQIRAWGKSLRLKNVSHLDLCWDQLCIFTIGSNDDPDYHYIRSLSDEQIEALQEVTSTIKSFGLSANYIGFRLNPQEWHWLAPLMSNLTEFHFTGEIPIGLTVTELETFSLITRQIRLINFKNIFLYSENQDNPNDLTEELTALARASLDANHVCFSSLLNQLNLQRLEYFFNLCKPESLSICDIRIENHHKLLPLLQNRFIEPKILFLRNCNLHILLENELSCLFDPTSFIKYLDLESNHLSTLRRDELMALMKSLSNMEWVNLNDNGFETLPDDKWNEFIEILRLSGIKYLAPMKNLSTERKETLERTLKANCALTSLKYTARHFLLHHPMVPTLEKIPAINRYLIEEVDIIDTLNKGI